MSQAEDMSAIQRSIAATSPKTDDARVLKAEFIKWYDSLSFWDRTITSSSLVEAKKRRDAFLVANATTPAEIAAVRAVQKKGPPVSGQVGTLPPTIKRGAKNDPETVKKWQRIIKTEDDGKFGPGTEKATKAWQASHGLTADGKVGPKTWTVALGLEGTPTSAAKTVSSTSAKPSSGTAASTGTSTSAKPEGKLAKVKEKFRDETAGIPLWGKIVGGVLAILGIGAGVKAVQEANKSKRKGT
jgi:peptidoglycan hydrolase-like protein with peptidoglycan-binding domain